MSALPIAASRKPPLFPARSETPREETWPGCDLEALEEMIELVLHYRDRHVSSRGGRGRAEPCSCSALEARDDGFRRALGAELRAAIRKGELPELLRALRTLSSDPRLRALTPSLVLAAA